MKTRALLLSGLLAALLALPGEAAAYTFIQRLGCPGDTGAAWPPELLPSRWHVDRRGYSKIPMVEVLEVLQRSLGAWGGQWKNPCCSGFEHEFAGPTQSTAIESEGENVVGFEESAWPPSLGSPWAVIAVTLPQIEPGSCRIHGADMLFNGVVFHFRTDGRLDAPEAVDFESIAVHEFGHWIGLDHAVDANSPNGYLAESVMFPSYRGGTGDRVLYLDDKLGACALYPSSCGPCRENRDCPDGRICNDGACVPQRCGRDDDCPLGSVCGADGQCHRGCRMHAECGPDALCADGACMPRVPCQACKPCRRQRDCPGDYFCLPLGETRVCTKLCSSDAECDGDSVCHVVEDGIGYCGAPSSSFCTEDWTCSDAACPDLGAPCGSCGDRSDACVIAGGSPICSCTCHVDAHCDGGVCLRNPASGTKACFPREGLVACGSTYCPPGTVCRDGTCLPTCGSAVCAADEICELGKCTSPCPNCGPGEVCDPVRRRCAIEPACLGVECGPGQSCVDGTCQTVCGDRICKKGQVCDGGRCVAKKKSSSGGCSTGAGAASPLAILLLLGLAARHRR